jgi:hypothetical protein
MTAIDDADAVKKFEEELRFNCSGLSNREHMLGLAIRLFRAREVEHAEALESRGQRITRDYMARMKKAEAELSRFAAQEEALKLAAQKFREYERLHRAKAAAPPRVNLYRQEIEEREAKAEANARMAEMCEAALAPSPASEPPETKEEPPPAPEGQCQKIVCAEGCHRCCRDLPCFLHPPSSPATPEGKRCCVKVSGEECPIAGCDGHACERSLPCSVPGHGEKEWRCRQSSQSWR